MHREQILLEVRPAASHAERAPIGPPGRGFELLFRSVAFACLQDQERTPKLQLFNAANFGCGDDFHVIKPKAPTGRLMPPHQPQPVTDP